MTESDDRLPPSFFEGEARARAFWNRLERAGLVPDREEAMAERTIVTQRWIIPTGRSAENPQFQLIDRNGRVVRSMAVPVMQWQIQSHSRRISLEFVQTGQMRLDGNGLIFDLEGTPVTVIGDVMRTSSSTYDVSQISLILHPANCEHEQWSEPVQLDAPIGRTDRSYGRITAIVPVMGVDRARESEVPQVCRNCHYVYGRRDNGKLVVCAVHPMGNGENCKDFESR